MAASWFVSHRGQRRGPFPPETLQLMVDRGEVEPDDLVWCEGMADWVPARTVIKPSDYRPPRSERPYGGERRYYEDRLDRDEEDRPRRRHDADREPDIARRQLPKGPPPQFPGRLITPAFFLLAFLLFFLPWVDVHRNVGSVVHQSGLQLCFGGHTNAHWGLFNPPPAGRLPQHDPISPAPLMIVFGTLVLLGFVLGLALHTGTARALLTGLPALAAFILLVVQASIGFPIQANVDRVNQDIRPLDPFGGRAPFGVNPFNPFDSQYRVSTTPWFWLALILLLGVGIGLLIEHLAIFRSNSSSTLALDESED